ncbi:class I adenylate-forming enzyme family protein [Variovorax sp. GB1P17]|uniref:class I adenylate-forming enzyme family protein n=1 Tax=Variovorax sp. GB1P17 TaxID=3443740 RepID=UPI003F450B31
MQTADIERTGIARISLADIIRRSARRNPHKTAVIQGDRRISFAALDAASERVGEALRDHGLAGRRVATMCINSIEHLTAIQAIHKSGNVWVPVNVQLDAASIEHVLSHAEVSGVFIDAVLFEVPALRELVARLGLATVVIGAREASAGTLQFDALASRPPAQPLADPGGDDDLALIMYTSGTTGKQKGVMHSHRSIHGALLSCAQSFEATERDVVGSVLPLFHCAQHTISMGALMAGATIWLASGFDPAAMLAAVERERISWLSCLPMMFDALMKHPQRPRTDLSSLRLCMYGLAPMPKNLLADVQREMCADVRLGTGQTEMYPPTMVYRASEHPDKDGNCWGVSVAGVETAVMDDDGKLLGPGEIGEIVHRGPNVFLGYLKDLEATAAARRFGWHHTGDIGMFDADGQMLFLDRKKDMIKSGGENVSSIKLEAVLLAHPAVGAAAVVGLPHPHWGEAVAAFVVLRQADGACGEDELLTFCKERLGRFEVPKSIRFVSALPMTPTGKVQKFQLRNGHLALFESAQG